MAANNKNFYLGRNDDGFICTYDAETHRCVDVMISTGDDIELYKTRHDEYIGQLDPNYKE